MLKQMVHLKIHGEIEKMLTYISHKCFRFKEVHY